MTKLGIPCEKCPAWQPIKVDGKPQYVPDQSSPGAFVKDDNGRNITKGHCLAALPVLMMVGPNLHTLWPETCSTGRCESARKHELLALAAKAKAPKR